MTQDDRWPDVMPFAQAVAQRMGCATLAVTGLAPTATAQPSAGGPVAAAIDIAAAGPGHPGSPPGLLGPGTVLVVGPQTDPRDAAELLAAGRRAAVGAVVLAREAAQASADPDWDRLEDGRGWMAARGVAPWASGFTRHSAAAAARITELHVAFPGFARDAAAVPDGFDVLAIVPVYNEHDVVEVTLDRLLRQGLRVHVIDNWSDDGSYEAVQGLTAREPFLTVERFPHAPEEHYVWSSILERLDRVGARSSASWVLHVDADEQFEAFSADVDLRQALRLADRSGFDVVDFTVIDFRPTAASVAAGGLPTSWEFGLRTGHRNIQRAWRNRGVRMGLAETGGHVVRAARRPFPLNFVLRHYPLRSPEHARQKIYRDRLPRVQASADRTQRGWHRQYDGFRGNDPFLWDESELQPWDDRTRALWLPELTTRAGLRFGQGSYESSPFAPLGSDGAAPASGS